MKSEESLQAELQHAINRSRTHSRSRFLLVLASICLVILLFIFSIYSLACWSSSESDLGTGIAFLVLAPILFVLSGVVIFLSKKFYYEYALVARIYIVIGALLLTPVTSIFLARRAAPALRFVRNQWGLFITSAERKQLYRELREALAKPRRVKEVKFHYLLLDNGIVVDLGRLVDEPFWSPREEFLVEKAIYPQGRWGDDNAEKEPVEIILPPLGIFTKVYPMPIYPHYLPWREEVREEYGAIPALAYVDGKCLNLIFSGNRKFRFEGLEKIGKQIKASHKGDPTS